MPARTPEHQAELDARARAAGYRNYAELEARQLFLERERQMRQPPRALDFGDRLAQNIERAKQNVLSLHPATLFSYVKDRMRGAAQRGSDAPIDIHMREILRRRAQQEQQQRK